MQGKIYRMCASIYDRGPSRALGRYTKTTRKNAILSDDLEIFVRLRDRHHKTDKFG